MNYIIDAFKALEDIDDSAVRVTPRKQEVKEPSRKKEPASLKESARKTIREATNDYWVLSDGKNPRNSRVYSQLADVDGFISRLSNAGTNGGYLELLHYVKGNPIKVWDSKSGRVTEARKKDRSDEMQPQFDHRQSFYGKARVIVKDDGSKVLYSYGTPVVRIKDGKVTLLRKGYLGWASSATTLRHVKEFLKQNGFKADSLKQIGADYPVEQAGVNESYDDLDVSWDSVCQEIIDKVKEVLGKDITCNDIHYDDSRAYGLYVPGDTLGLNCNKFGAYRNYLGGGMRGPIEHNGRAQDGTEELGEFFAKVLSEIEEMIAFDDGTDECLKEGKKLHENEEVKLSDEKAVKGAIDKLSNKEEEEPTEKIVDADADTIDKVKDSYLGNAVLICKKCREPFFRKPEELRKDEANDKLFNVGDACPHCGSETGYELGGQIAKLDVEAEDEDSKDDGEEGKDKPEEGKRKLTPIDIPEEGSEEDNGLMKAESFDNSGFDKLINKHLSEVYSNVVSYETKSGEVSGKELTLEGTIKYKDGKEEQVRFVFEAVKTTKDKKIILSGLNEKMAGDKGSYKVVARVSDNSILAESMSCNYKVRLNESDKVVRGRYSLNKGLAEAWTHPRVVEEGSKEHDNLKKACDILNKESSKGIKYELETTYLDYGQRWEYTAIIANDPEHKIWGGSWQVLSPRDWEEIANAESDDELMDAIKDVRDDEYFLDVPDGYEKPRKVNDSADAEWVEDFGGISLYKVGDKYSTNPNTSSKRFNTLDELKAYLRRRGMAEDTKQKR